MMAQHHYSFPGGHRNRRPRPARLAQGAHGRLSAAAGELDANGQHLSEQISEIDLTDPEDARVLMPEQGTDILAHFGEDHFLERYQRYKAHIAEWRQQYPKLAAVDLRYDQQVVLEMTPGAGGAQTALQPTGEPTQAARPRWARRKPVRPSAAERRRASAKPAAERNRHNAAGASEDRASARPLPKAPAQDEEPRPRESQDKKQRGGEDAPR